MKDVKIRISADTSGAKKGIDDVTTSTKKLDKGVSGVDKSTSKLTGSLDKMTGGAVTGLKSFATGLKAIAGGFRTIGGAIAASGIGLIVITIAALTAAFKGSEEGQNKFAKIMGVIGAVTGNLVDLLADFGELVISAFENPKKAITDFANLIKTNITNRFDGLMELIPALGKAFEQLFSGEFSAAAEIAGNAVAKVTLGIDDLSGKIKAATDATKDFIDQNIKEGNAAAKVADQRAKADKIERGLLVRRANAEREIAKLRLKAKDLNNVSAEERQAALKEVLSIQDGLAKSEVEIATLRSDAQTAENTFARSTKENLLEEERLKAAVRPSRCPLPGGATTPGLGQPRRGTHPYGGRQLWPRSEPRRCPFRDCVSQAGSESGGHTSNQGLPPSPRSHGHDPGIRVASFEPPAVDMAFRVRRRARMVGMGRPARCCSGRRWPVPADRWRIRPAVIRRNGGTHLARLGATIIPVTIHSAVRDKRWPVWVPNSMASLLKDATDVDRQPAMDDRRRLRYPSRRSGDLHRRHCAHAVVHAGDTCASSRLAGAPLLLRPQRQDGVVDPLVRRRKRRHGDRC